MSILRKAVQGAAWNLITGVGARILQLVGTLILTRFIAPAEYGEVYAAVISVSAAHQLSYFAFGQYLIARKSPADEAFQAGVLHLLVGGLAMSVVYLFRAPLGALVDAPDMGRFVPGLILGSMLERLRYIPQRLLVRDLEFRTVAILNSVGELTFTVTAVALAPLWGGAAIVAGSVARSGILVVPYFWRAPREQWLAPTPLRLATVRALFSYGAPLMVSTVAYTAATRWDNLILSRMFGLGVMGRYNLAYSLAETPVSYVAEHIGDVLMPSYAKLERAERQDAVIRAASLMAIVIAPLGVGLGAVAPTVVSAFFDARWAGMAPMLAILSVMTVFRPMSWSASAYLQAEEHTRPIMMLSLARAVLLLLLVAVFAHVGGPLLACAAAGVAFFLHGVLSVYVTGRLTGLPVAPYILGVMRALLACTPMFGAVTLAHLGLRELGLPSAGALPIEVLVGAASYVGGVFLIDGNSARQLVRLGREALRRRRDKAAPVEPSVEPTAEPTAEPTVDTVEPTAEARPKADSKSPPSPPSRDEG